MLNLSAHDSSGILYFSPPVCIISQKHTIRRQMSLKIQDGDIIRRYVIFTGIHSYFCSPMYASNKTQFISQLYAGSCSHSTGFRGAEQQVCGKQNDVAM